MKALIRHEFETITQDMNIPFIEWNTGAPLTNAEWSGGPYTLVNDYVPPAARQSEGEAQELRCSPEPVEGHEESQPIQSTPVEEKPAEQPSEALPETVTYGGKEYTLEELKKLIG